MIALIVTFIFAAFAETPQPADSLRRDDTLSVIALSTVLGETITRSERDHYHFFPDIDHFESATLLVTPSFKYFFRFTRRTDQGRLADTIVEWSGASLTRMAEISQHFEVPQREEASTGIYSQETAAGAADDSLEEEMLVPFVESRSIYRIDSEMDLNLNLFSDYSGFTEASLFRLKDSLYALEVLRNKGGIIWKTRKLLNAQQVQQLQNKIFSTITLRSPNTGIDQSGRSAFLGNIYSVSIGLYGWGIPYLLDWNGSAAVGTYLLFNAGAVLLANSATENSEISTETANLTIFGTGSGFVHGTLLSLIFNDKTTDLQPFLAFTMVTTGIEGYISYRAAQQLRLTGSQVDILATSSALGMLYGFGTTVLFDINSRKGIATTLLAGSIVGTYFGVSISDNPNLSAGNLNVIRGAFFLGVYVPMTVFVAVENKSAKAFVGASMAGGIIGIGVGNSIIQHKNFTSAEGIIVMSGVLGGALLAGGIPVLLKVDPKVSLLLSGIGAIAGYSVTYSKYSGTAELRSNAVSLDMRIHPESLLSLSVQNSHVSPYPNIAPVFSLTYHF